MSGQAGDSAEQLFEGRSNRDAANAAPGDLRGSGRRGRANWILALPNSYWKSADSKLLSNTRFTSVLKNAATLGSRTRKRFSSLYWFAGPV